ncbi:hypothetical protein [Clostridium hydrogeniformans]|uniref:hypothetical protein n=1 Tax=Clostridium hydrogeniformans TaxID=349933 RepID=UPI0004880C3C|nr:hypothetical protein [Clostridium hydrogeniformans]
MRIYAVKFLDSNEKILNNISSGSNLDKRYKIEKLINKKDKIRTLIGELLIRTIMVERLGIKNKNITFEKINLFG